MPCIHLYVLGNVVNQTFIYFNVHLLAFLVYNSHAGFKVRRGNIRRQSAFKTGAYSVVQRFNFLNRAVKRYHNLLVVLEKGIKGVEKFFLRLFFTCYKMDIVYQQHVNIAELIAEIVNSAEPQLTLLQCLYKLICEILAPYILNFFIGEVFLYLVFYSQHKVGFTHARGSVNNKGVVGVCGVGRHRV